MTRHAAPAHSRVELAYLTVARVQTRQYAAGFAAADCREIDAGLGAVVAVAVAVAVVEVAVAVAAGVVVVVVVAAAFAADDTVAVAVAADSAGVVQYPTYSEWTQVWKNP